MAGRALFGTVRRLTSGRWQARYQLPDGTRLTAPSTFATKANALDWLAAKQADLARGHRFNATGGKVTLAEYATEWLAGRSRLAPRTREIYELQLRLHVLPSVTPDVPALGEQCLTDLTPELVRAWYAALARQRSQSVAAKAYARLRQLMRDAVDDDRIVKSPCRIRGGSAERHPEQRFASMEQLVELAAAVPDRYRALVLTAGLAGLRQGELYGLRRSDVDLLHRTITVRRKRLRLASGVVIEDDPKTDAG